MEIIVNTNVDQFADVWVKHGTQQIGFRLPTIFKRNATREGVSIDLYSELNQYFARLPKEEQDKLFELYGQMKTALDNQRLLKVSRAQLRGCIKEFYEVFKIEDALHWIKFHSDINIPANIEDEYVQRDDKPYTRKMTYVRDDYRQLQALILLLRAMIPVWGEILWKEAKSIDSDWKEYMLYQLLGETNLKHCEPMEKLRHYALTLYQSESAKTKNAKDNGIDSGIFSGMSSYDFPEWLLGFILVRKIVVGSLSSTGDENSHLISSIHNMIVGKLTNNSQNFSGLVRKKDVYEDQGDDDSKLSVLEKIRKRFQLADGEIALMEVVASDILKSRAVQYPWLPMSTLKEALQAVKGLDVQQIHTAQMSIAEAILQDRLEVGELDCFTWSVLLDNLALAQALAWHRGHYVAAALITAEAIPSSGAGYGRLPKEKIEALDKIFPYHHRVLSKQKKEVQRQVNPGIKTIETVFTDLQQFDWRLTTPAAWQPKLADLMQHGTEIQVPYDIRTYLADLIIDFQTGDFK